MTQSLNLQDNTAAIKRPELYTCIQVDTAKVIKSWQLSVFSYEWLTPEGDIKHIEEMSEAESERRRATENAIKNNKPLEKPVLGIGIQDNIEIGAGRAVLLTLAAHDIKTLPVHILKSNESDFKDFLADVP